MKKTINIILVLISLNTVLSAQNWNDVMYYESEAEYMLLYNQFEEAIDLYKEALELVPSSANLKFKIGYVYLLSDDKQNEAIPYLIEAAEGASKSFNPSAIKETSAPIEAHFLLGNAYLINNDIDKAIASYQKFRDLSDTEDIYSFQLANKYIENCNNAMEAQKSPLKVNATNLGEIINNKNSNRNAVLSGDGQYLAYNTYTKDGVDIFVAKKDANGNWGRPKKQTAYIGEYLRVSSLSHDGSTMYLIYDDPGNYEIFVSSLQGKYWTKAKKLKKPINTKSQETHATISKDGNTLYFTSDREGGIGGLDIYKSTIDAKGKWSDPVNLGSAINTEFNEETPFLNKEENLIFFSSEGHKSYGGYDVFYTNLNGGEVKNIGYPVNDTRDNLFYFPENNNKSGYISYFDATGKGKKDIYHVSIFPNIPFTGKIKSDFFAENTDIYEITITDNNTNQVVLSLNLDAAREDFSHELPAGKYNVLIKNSSHTDYSMEIDILENDDFYILEAFLNPKVPDQEIYLADTDTEEDIIPETEILLAENIVEEDINEEEQVVEEPLVTENNIEKELIETKQEVAPIIEETKHIESPTQTISTIGNYFTVQIAALNQPVDLDHFRNIDEISVSYSGDNYYRYTVGNAATEAAAEELLTQIQQLGYEDAFITTNNSKQNYTIQFMAMKYHVDYRHFNSLPLYSVTKTKSGYYQYTFGNYQSYSDARDKLPLIASLGYEEAFVKELK